MKIYEPKILKKENGRIFIGTQFESVEGKNTLWYKLDEKYEEYICLEKADGFFLTLLLLASKNNEDIYLEAPISEKLFYNVSQYYTSILPIIDERFKKIKIYPNELNKGNSYKCLNKVATGYAAGVDSFATICDNLRDEIPKSYKITHFLYNNVGSLGQFRVDTESAREAFEAKYKLIKQYPEEVGIDLIKVDSNVSEVIDMEFITRHTPSNTAVAMLLQKLFGKFIYSSAYTYKDISVVKKYTAKSDPITLPLLSTETLECIAHGSQYTRVEKTAIISNYEPTYRHLNVCTEQREDNCSVCEKCCRTLFTLELLGKLDHYKKVFNLKKYKAERDFYIMQMLKNKNFELSGEMYNLAKEKNFKFTLIHKVGALIILLLPTSVKKFAYIIKDKFLKRIG